RGGVALAEAGDERCARIRGGGRHPMPPQDQRFGLYQYAFVKAVRSRRISCRNPSSATEEKWQAPKPPHLPDAATALARVDRAARAPAFRAAAITRFSARMTRQARETAIAAVRSVETLSATITSIASALP